MHVLLSYKEENCICGNHLHQNMWTTKLVNLFVCEREPSNSSARYVQYAVAVLKGGVVVAGHLPRQLS